MKISIIVATTEKGVIGDKEKLPWHVPQDLKRFRRLTLGHHILMGRKTFESIGRPLVKRISLVISRDRSFRPEGVHVFGNLNKAIAFAKKAGEKELMVIGGAQIYAQMLPKTEKIYQTVILKDFEGDAFFPEPNENDWRQTSKKTLKTSVAPLIFRTLQRR